MTLPEARAALAAHDTAYAALQAHTARQREHAAGRPTPPKGSRPAPPSTP